MKNKIIACEVMKEEINSLASVTDAEIEYVPMGFHLYPKKLRAELQNIIDSSAGFDRIILSFGLCGGAASGLKANGCVLTIPKIHDCISAFLYSGNGCANDFEKERGTFYLSCGWMLTERSIFSEYKRMVLKYGEKKAVSLLHRIYAEYKRVLFIKTGSPLENGVIIQSQQVARLIDAKHEVIEGNNIFLKKIIKGPWDDNNFINIAPYETLNEEYFFTKTK